jgi:hypothetical protein
MVRVFHATDGNPAAESLWSFNYVDWQGKQQIGIGTESRVETQRLAERVQAEHDLLRREMRPKVIPIAPPALIQDDNSAPLEATDPNTVGFQVTDKRSPRLSEPRPLETHSDRSTHSVRVGEQLIAGNVISRPQLEEALEHQKVFGGRIIDVLIQLGYLTAEAFLVFLGNRPGIPRIVLDNYAELPKEVLKLITPEMAIELEVIPIDKLGTTISVAMVCPLDLDALERIQEHTGLKVRPLLCSRPEYRTALRIHYGKSATPTARKSAK